MLAEVEGACGMKIGKVILVIFLTLQFCPAWGAMPSVGETSEEFLQKYPHLKANLAQEPDSRLYLGLSVGALGLLKNRMLFSANFFQLHYITDTWDSELLSISFGATSGSPNYVQSNHFIFRTVPKYRINKWLSAGPVVGYEFVSFPAVSAVLFEEGYQTKPEPFSSAGWIYGLGFSENWKTEAGHQIKVNQILYQQNYSTDHAGHGWSYLFDLRSLRSDPTPIKAGLLFLLEVGVLF